jgi:group I intron endonuclease
MRAHIYKLTNKRNGFIYIGSTKHDIADRFYQHWKQRRSYDKPLYQAMCETEREDWSVELLATVDAKDRWNVEKEMTLYFRETASGCYNIYDGYTKSGAKNPMYGKQHSAVSKEKMSAALSGRKISAA